jgi:hypothetical protein
VLTHLAAFSARLNVADFRHREGIVAPLLASLSPPFEERLGGEV